MSPVAELALLSLLLLAGTLAAAALPIALKPRAHQTDAVVAFAAGVLLGAAFFHLLPEALRVRGPLVLLATGAGVLTLLLVERLLRAGVTGTQVEVHRMMHGDPIEAQSDARGHGAPLGLIAFAGLSLHTLSDGLALGSAMSAGAGGLIAAVFTAIFAHQLPTAFALAALLRREGRSAATTLSASAVFALMVPVGAALYLVALPVAGLSPLAWTLAFSAGNFLHLAFGDLLPDLRRSDAGRPVLAVAVLAGLALMALLRLAENG